MATAPHDTARVLLLQKIAKSIFDHDQPAAFDYARRCLAEARQLHWAPGEAWAFQLLGWLYWRQSDYHHSQQYTLEALKRWEALGRRAQVLPRIEFIGGLLSATRQYAKAAKWQQRALSYAQALHDTVGIATNWVSLGLLESHQQRPKSALPYYLKALALLEKVNRSHNRRSRPSGTYTILAITLNDLADTYASLNQPRVALQYALRALRVGQQHCVAHEVIAFESTAAEIYGRLGKLDMAVFHASNAYQAAKKVPDDKSTLLYTNQLLDTLYAQQGNYRLSRQHARQGHALEVSVLQQEQERKVAETQGRYDLKEKERNIKLLQQQNRIEQLDALQLRTVRNAGVVIVGLLLLAVGILYNRYRLRQRTVRLLDEQNREKALLLQEVHHRVKNNLQIVLSLFNSQLSGLADPVAAAALRESQSRVRTMALIHQNLYQSDSLARIDMRRYLAELLDAIGRAFRREEVAVVLDVAPVHLSTDTAVPLGLVVNELVTNAYKYAFAGRPAGNELRIELHLLGAKTYRLVVADNGVGLPPLDFALVRSLGLRLAGGLLRQMQAQVTVEREGGTRFHIVFREPPGPPAGTEAPVSGRQRAPAAA